MKARFAIVLVAMVMICVTTLAQENTAQGWYKKGQDLDRNGFHNESVQAYYKALNLTNETLKKNPKDVVAWQTSGLVLESLDRTDEAAKAFDKAIELNPQCAEAWLHKGMALYLITNRLQGQERNKTFEDAVKAYDKAIEINPNYGEAWEDKGYSLGSLASFSKNLSKFNESLNAFDKAIELIPVNDTMNLALAWDGRANTLAGMGNTLDDTNRRDEAKAKREEALNDYGKAIELDRNFTGLEARLHSAGILTDLGRYNESLAAYDKIIETMPSNNSMDIYAANVWEGKGSVLEKMGKHEDALKTFDKAIELDPTDAGAWKGKGDSLNNSGRYDEAVKAYDKAIEAGEPYSLPFKAMLWNGKGDALKALGRNSEADASFAKAKELGTLTVTVAQENTADYWIKKGNDLVESGSFEEALTDYNKAIQIDPENLDAWDRKALIFYVLDQQAYRKVLNLSEMRLAKNPQDAWTWQAHAAALTSLGRQEEANQSQQKALEIYDQEIKDNPKNATAWFYKAELTANRTEALSAYEKVIELNGSMKVEALITKGNILLNLGKSDEAIAAVDKAIQLDSKNFQAWEEMALVYHVLGKYNESLTAYEKLTEIKPENALVWKGKGDALKALDRQSEADAAYAKAKELGYSDSS